MSDKHDSKGLDLAPGHSCAKNKASEILMFQMAHLIEDAPRVQQATRSAASYFRHPDRTQHTTPSMVRQHWECAGARRAELEAQQEAQEHAGMARFTALIVGQCPRSQAHRPLGL